MCDINTYARLDDASGRNDPDKHGASPSSRPAIERACRFHFLEAEVASGPLNGIAVPLPFNRESCIGAVGRRLADKCCRKLRYRFEHHSTWLPP